MTEAPTSSRRPAHRLGDLIAGTTTAAFGAAVALYANTFPKLDDGSPGPGLFPTVVGALLALFGAVLITRWTAARLRDRVNAPTAPTPEPPTPDAPDADVPTAPTPEAPTSEVPGADVPAGSASEDPDADVPAAGASEAPTSEVPGADVPAGSASEDPSADVPAGPASEAPGADIPAADAPEAPTSEVPGADVPAAPTPEAPRPGWGVSSAARVGSSPCTQSVDDGAAVADATDTDADVGKDGAGADTTAAGSADASTGTDAAGRTDASTGTAAGSADASTGTDAAGSADASTGTDAAGSSTVGGAGAFGSAARSRMPGRALVDAGLVLAAVVFYILVADLLGFAVTMAVLLFVLSWRLGARFLVAAGTAVLVPALVYLVFQRVLLVPLPLGPFG